MKKVYIFISLFLMLLSLSLTQCSFETKSIPTTTNTVSRIPSETYTHTFLPTSTPTSSPTITLTPINTLTQEQWAKQFETIRELLITPFPDCEFPCFWGITPGKTSWLEAADFLAKNQLAFYEYEQAAYYFGSGWQMFQVDIQKLGQEILGLDVYFYVYKNIIQHINIGDYYGTPGNTWRTTWAALSPDKLIPMLGKPSRVQIYGGCGGSEGSTMNDCMYSLYVFYDTRGVYLHYSLYTNLGYSGYLCPTFGNGGNVDQWFKIILKSPDDVTPIEKYDEGYQPGLSFEKATGKALDEFYQLFLQAKNPPCFKVLGEAFSP